MTGGATVSSTNDSEHDFISSEVLTISARPSARAESIPTACAMRWRSPSRSIPTTTELKRLRDLGAHYFVLPSNGDGFELRLGHHDLETLNATGAVAGEYLSLGVVKTVDIGVGTGA